MKLSKSEEQVMRYIWKLEKAFLKDILHLYPVPKPATTTLATLLKRMKEKGFIDYTTHGKSRLYVPLIAKGEYTGGKVKNLIKDFFGDSTATFASFFTREADLSKDELKELRALIDQEIKKKS